MEKVFSHHYLFLLVYIKRLLVYLNQWLKQRSLFFEPLGLIVMDWSRAHRGVGSMRIISPGRATEPRNAWYK
jgi:hypothetical protein